MKDEHTYINIKERNIANINYTHSTIFDERFKKEPFHQIFRLIYGTVQLNGAISEN